MGNFEVFAYVDSEWVDDVSGDRWLTINIHDSDIAMFEYSPAPYGLGVFYLGTEPRRYFDDPTASRPVDIDSESVAFARWAYETLGVHVAPAMLRNELSGVNMDDPRDVFVEDSVTRLLSLLAIDPPPSLANHPPGGDPEEIRGAEFIALLTERAREWVGSRAQVASEPNAKPPNLSLIPHTSGAASIWVTAGEWIEIHIDRSPRQLDVDFSDDSERTVDEMLLAIINGRVSEIWAPGRSQMCLDLGDGRLIVEEGFEPGLAASLPLPGWRRWGARKRFERY